MEYEQSLALLLCTAVYINFEAMHWITTCLLTDAPFDKVWLKLDKACGSFVKANGQKKKKC